MTSVTMCPQTAFRAVKASLAVSRTTAASALAEPGWNSMACFVALFDRHG
jgi:hypothetical protein